MLPPFSIQKPPNDSTLSSTDCQEHIWKKVTGSTSDVYRLYKDQESAQIGLTAPSKGIIFSRSSRSSWTLRLPSWPPPKEKKKIEQAGILEQISHRQRYIVPLFNQQWQPLHSIRWLELLIMDITVKLDTGLWALNDKFGWRELFLSFGGRIMWVHMRRSLLSKWSRVTVIREVSHIMSLFAVSTCHLRRNTSTRVTRTRSGTFVWQCHVFWKWNRKMRGDV